MTKNKYKAASGAGYNDAKAQIIGERLEKLAVVTPKAVLEDASNPKSPLHSFFEWNDTVAARKYRQMQARNLINHLLIVVKTPDGGVDTKAFHSIKIQRQEQEEPEQKRIYVSFGEATKSPDTSEQIIRNAKAELLRWQARYRQYSHLLGPIYEAVEAFVSQNSTEQSAEKYAAMPA